MHDRTMRRCVALLAGALAGPCALAGSPRVVEVLAIAAQYSDAQLAARAPETLARLMQRTADFYAEGSGGRYVVRATTHPVVLTLPQPRPEGRCALPSPQQLGAAIGDAGIDLARFERLMLIVPASAGGCNGGRATTFTYRRDGSLIRMPIGISFSLTDRFVIHEYGHGDGLGHAQSVDCGDQVIGPRCAIRTYGNVWDTMGNGYVQTYQAAFRAHLGWVQPIVHASGTATYTIGPAYTPGSLPGAIELRMPAPKPDTIRALAPMSLWIEWRAPRGFDSRMARFESFANGVMVNVTGRWTAASGKGKVYDCPRLQPCLLDMTPGDRRHQNGGLEVGQSWTDPNTGVSIRVDARTDTSMTLTVSVP